ncbi:MAG: histidine phosphatase family protein [Acidimicrobiales bacterium]
MTESRHPVLLVRHGQTTWSAEGRHTGRTDVPLTEEGRRQASRVGTRLAEVPWALVLSSPLARARETCRLAGLGVVAQTDPDLAEWDYGAYEGLTTAEIRSQRPSWWLWSDGCPAGESPADVAARADRVINRCMAADGPVALFSHGHLLRVLGSRWVDADAGMGAVLLLSTAAISVLGWERDTPVLARWNDTSHVDGGSALPD